MNSGSPVARRRPRAALAFRKEIQPWLFPADSWTHLRDQVDPVTEPFTAADWRGYREQLGGVEVLIGSWGIPVLDREILDAMPALKVVLYGAGSVRGFVTGDFWQRNIQLSSAAHANARPTAAFAEAMIVLSLKHTWYYLRRNKPDWAYLSETASSGVHGATVGIIGFSRVGQEVIRGLQRHEMTILVHDPTMDPERARQHGVQLVDLPALFARSDVVSLHAPLLPSTAGMVRGEHFRLMRPQATFVNTARGGLVREDELVTALAARPDLTAVLDVTDPEPAPADSPLRALPNVVITPHLAGARHREIDLIGRVVLAELDRYLAGLPLQWSLQAFAVANQA